MAATVVANIGAAMADFTGAKFASANSVRVCVPSSWLPALGTLKVAGAVGLLLGLLGVPYIDIAAAVGLVLFFLAAIGVHLRAREHRHHGHLLRASSRVAGRRQRTVSKTKPNPAPGLVAAVPVTCIIFDCSTSRRDTVRPQRPRHPIRSD
jgi:hypothetical protein